MPIRAELKHFYTGPLWKAAREQIIKRAGDCCEQCKVPNRVTTWRNGGYWVGRDAMVRNHLGVTVFHKNRFAGKRNIKIVLCVAHLDHNPANRADSNLKLLCQWCHLAHDRTHHIKTARARRWAELSKNQEVLF